jgi:hypothetical protein
VAIGRVRIFVGEFNDDEDEEEFSCAEYDDACDDSIGTEEVDYAGMYRLCNGE